MTNPKARVIAVAPYGIRKMLAENLGIRIFMKPRG